MQLCYNKSVLILLFMLALSFASGQLLPAIGSSTLPQDSAEICSLPWSLSSAYEVGYSESSFVHDFELWDTDNQAWQLSNMLDEHPYVLLIQGSFTCPRFRQKVDVMHEVYDLFYPTVLPVVVYTPEAHPTNYTPYFTFVNTGQNNIDAGILYEQPETYGERKDIALDMIEYTGLSLPVLLDEPCNSWWHNYGRTANNSYLIGQGGLVLSYQGWFDRSPDDIICDIESILNEEGDCLDFSDSDLQGIFQFNSAAFASGDSLLGFGAPEDVVIVEGLISNPTAYPLQMEIIRDNNLPADWASALCLDVCLPETVDQTGLYLEAGGTQSFSVYFYTGGIPNAGTARITLSNPAHENNYGEYIFGASTLTQSVAGAAASSADIVLRSEPKAMTFKGFERASIQIFDTQGKKILANDHINENAFLDLSFLANGVYFARLIDQNGRTTQLKFVAQ